MKKIFNSIRNRGLFSTFILCLGSIFYSIIKKLIFDLYYKSLKVRDNIILFDSYPDFSDNSLYLYKYLLKSNSDFKFVWLVDDTNKIKKEYKNTIFVKKKSKFHAGLTLKALYYVSISSRIFFTHGSPFNYIKPKNNQLVINLWHGCGYKQNSLKGDKKFIDINYFDYVLVPGQVFINTKSEFFGCLDTQVLPLGYPRYDELLNEDSNIKNKIKSIFGNNKLIVWMPTFRKTINHEYPEEKINNNYDLPLLESTKDLEKINEICKKNNITLVIKRHPYQISYVAEKIKFSNIMFIDNQFLINNNIELYSLLKYSDGLITDYSSVAIDYLLIDKPIAFMLADFKNYNEARGFVFEEPLNYMPGHHIYKKEDLFEFFGDIILEKDTFKNKREAVLKDVHNLCDNYCEKITIEIERLYNEKVRGNKNEKI